MIKMSSELNNMDVAQYARRRHGLLKSKIHSSESESDVRQSVLALYDLDIVGNLEKHRVDFWSKELLIEFKLDSNLNSAASRCKVLAQLLHYIYQIPTKHGKFSLPSNIGLVDKKCFILYKTEDFIKYLFKDSYFTEADRPSSDHPMLEKDIRLDAMMKGTVFHTIADYQEVWSELEKRGVYEY